VYWMISIFHTHSGGHRSLIQPLLILQRKAFVFSTFSVNRSIVVSSSECVIVSFCISETTLNKLRADVGLTEVLFFLWTLSIILFFKESGFRNVVLHLKN